MKRYKGTGIYYAKLKASDTFDSIVTAARAEVLLLHRIGYGAYLRGHGAYLLRGRRGRRLALAVASSKRALKKIMGARAKLFFRGIRRVSRRGE